MDSFDLVNSLQALPETDPIEVDGVQFGGPGDGGCSLLTILAIALPGFAS